MNWTGLQAVVVQTLDSGEVFAKISLHYPLDRDLSSGYSAMHLWTTETSSFIFMLFLLFYPFPIPVPISAPISDPGFLVFQTPMHHSLTDVTWWKFDVFDRKWAIKNPIFTGLPLGHAQLWFRFWVVSAEKRIAGGGKTRGMVPRNDVLTSGFVRFFLARIFFYFPPQETQKALRIKS